jgi:hypothetical protein
MLTSCIIIFVTLWMRIQPLIYLVIKSCTPMDTNTTSPTISYLWEGGSAIKPKVIGNNNTTYFNRTGEIKETQAPTCFPLALSQNEKEIDIWLLSWYENEAVNDLFTTLIALVHQSFKTLLQYINKLYMLPTMITKTTNSALAKKRNYKLMTPNSCSWKKLSQPFEGHNITHSKPYWKD